MKINKKEKDKTTIQNRMHVENELAKIVTIGDHEFTEIVEKYKEEILVQEEVPEPPLTDSASTAPAQGKPRCITPYFLESLFIYVMCIYITEILWKPPA